MQALRDEVKTAAAAAATFPPPGLPSPARTSVGRNSESNASSSPWKVPHEDRCDAIIANLGNGLSPQEHMDKAKMALATAAIPKTWYTEQILPSTVEGLRPLSTSRNQDI